VEQCATLIVVYDYGSLAPTRIASIAAAHGGRVVFVVPDTAHNRDTRPLLASVGQVLTVDGDHRRELVSACRALRPAGIVTFSEQQIRFTAGLAAELGLAYHAPADVDAIVRKDVQRRRFAEAGLETIRFRLVERPDQVDEAMAHVGFPAVIKPVYGAASRNTVAVHDEGECRAALTAMLREDGQAPREPVVVLEELLVGRATEPPWGDFIAIDCVSEGDKVHPRFVTSKFAVAHPFRDRGGYGTSSVVPQEDIDQAGALAARAVNALGIRQGLSDVEMKLTPSGPRLIEVNGRLGGTVDDIAVRSGNTAPAEIAIAQALGLPVEIGKPDTSGPIAFHYHVFPPAGARGVAAVHSPLRMKRLPNVDKVIVHVRAGDAVRWRAGTESRAASVIGATGSHAELSALVAEIEEVPWIQYQY
jgi:biotin carboxylase